MRLKTFIRNTHLQCKSLCLKTFVAPFDYMRNSSIEKKQAAPKISQGDIVKEQKKRLCVFAHFDRDNKIDPYVCYYLQQLAKNDCEVIFVSTCAHLSTDELALVKPYCSTLIVRPNFGYDFYSYKVGLDAVTNLDCYQQIIFTNDSNYGPIYDLGPVFKSMDQPSIDMWGLIDSYEFAYHLQSFFLVFNKSAIEHPAFHQFWKKARPLSHKTLVILQYEIGISRYFARRGFRLQAYCHYDNVIKPYIGQHENARVKKLLGQQRINLTHYLWDKLIQQFQFPFVKIQLLRDNPAEIYNVNDWERIIGNASDYNKDYIHSHLQRMLGNK